MKKHYHFIGIGGIGMGALASLVMAQGHHASGSDLKDSAMTQRLKEEGAKIFIGHDARNVEDADFVIFSSAVDENNPELKTATARNIPILRRAQLLSQLMQGHIGITVAGAHGKTTTTSMISNLLINAGLQPTTAVGGIINGTTNNARLGAGRHFVAEVDESDGSFLYFSPQYSVITNIDFEHLDYYHNWENIIKAYREFIWKTTVDGVVIGFGDDERLMALLKASKRNFETYGFTKDHAVHALNIQFDHFSSRFDCIVHGKNMGPVVLNVPGQHNIANAMACISLGLKLNIDFNVIVQNLREYKGVNRRFQTIGTVDEVLVIDDYGHHPTEILATLSAAQKVKKNRLVVAFQPHRYTRLKSLLKEFAQSLTQCDYLIVTDVYAASEKPIEGITGARLSEEVQKISTKPVVYLEKDKIMEHLLKIVKPGDLVMTLGAGDITKISYELVEALKGARVMGHGSRK